jgi:type III secretion protein R
VAARALAGVVGSMVFLSATAGFAQAPGAGGPSPLSLVVLLAALSLLPFLLIMVTSFVKVAVVLSILRTAIGTQQVPPNQVITGLAIILSLYIMAPVGMEMYEEIAPQIEAYEQQRDTEEGPKFGLTEAREIGAKVAAPLRGFLLKHADEEERLLLYELALELRTPEQRESVAPDDLMVAVPAFVITELKEAFIIGFLLFVPFIVVDLVVANILLSLGMHMLSPTTVSLPFKLLLFVLVDGWYLVVRGLILGYV